MKIQSNLLKNMKDYKKTNAATTTVTRNFDDFTEKTGNLYKALVVCSKMANKINDSIRQELSQKLEDFASSSDTLEEIHENTEQIEVSKYFERLPKPTLIAVEEFLNDRVYFTKYESEEDSDINIEDIK